MCIAALNALLAFGKPPLVLAPINHAGSPYLGAPHYTFGPVAAVKRLQLEKDAYSLSQFSRIHRETFFSFRAMWVKEYQSEKRIDFDELRKWAKQFIDPARESSQVARVFNEAFQQRDPHSRLEPTQRVADYAALDLDSWVGTGMYVQLTKRGVLVQDVMPEGPAERAGLKPFDRILSIDGVPVVGQNLKQVTDRLSGPSGSYINIWIQRAERKLQIRVQRKDVSSHNVEAKLFKFKEGSIGVIKLDSFYPSTSAEDVGNAIDDLEGKGVKGLILDLRYNGGGAFDAAISTLGHFLGPHEIVAIRKEFAEKTPILYRTTKEKRTSLPLLVLINSSSGSASEIVAGALQDFKRAFVIGERSFGKSTVQTGADLSKMKGVFRGYPITYYQTTGVIHLPSGRAPQIHGIRPDFEVFSEPGLTEEEKFRLRETDVFPGTLSNPMPPPEPQRASEIQRIEQLRPKFGRAEAFWKGQAALPNGLPADFQLLWALDTMRCIWGS